MKDFFFGNNLVKVNFDYYCFNGNSLGTEIQTSYVTPASKKIIGSIDSYYNLFDNISKSATFTMSISLYFLLVLRSV